MLEKILLIVGIFEILLGISLYRSESEKFLYSISKIYDKTIVLDKLEVKEIVRKFLGQIVAIEGGIYLFLGSVSIYAKMNFLVVIILMIIIEVTFFNITKSKLKGL